MSKTIVALDCMGGDNAPFEIVKGAVEATNENKDILVKLVGVEEQIKEELSKYKYNSDQLEIVNATEIIETGEPPVAAIREKTDSSLVKCLYMVKKGEADGMVSAGSTGANLVGGHVIIGRLKGVQRPPLAPLIPTKNGAALLIDCGANVDSRPSHLVQFAKIGATYMENIVGVKNPRVGLVNIGAEEEKGNALTKEAYQLLKETKGINFIGNVEAREIPYGPCDVLVCEAFVGNVILKLYEGVGKALIKEIKSAMLSTTAGKIGGLLAKPSLKGVVKKFDASEYGGAPLLGLKGLVVKAHGSSKAKEVTTAIEQCVSFTEADIAAKIEKSLSV